MYNIKSQYAVNVIIAVILLILTVGNVYSQTDRVGFSFVQVCDPQLGFGGYEHDKKTFEQAVKQINSLKADFVVICGDLVDNANNNSFRDFNNIKEKLEIPCYCAAGNHDVGKNPTVKTLKRYRGLIGKDYYSFKHKGYYFIIVNTQLWKVNVKDESEKHDIWFKETLKSVSEKGYPIFVIGHHPIFVRTIKEREKHSNLPVERREDLLHLLEQYGVVAMLGGHTHRTVINNYKGIQLVNPEAISKNFDKRPLGFRIWHIKKSGSFTNEFVPLDINEMLNKEEDDNK